MAETGKITRSVESIMSKGDHSEGKLTKSIENQTAKLPSITFLNLAIGSMVLSAGLAIAGGKNEDVKPYANFVGLWAPTFLLLGIYNKLVKLEGNDQFSKG
jgi:hypothetical protein